MDPETKIMIAALLGAIGMGYIVYGRKQLKGSALAAGIALCVYPYFVPNLLLIILIGLGIMAAPFFIQD